MIATRSFALLGAVIAATAAWAEAPIFDVPVGCVFGRECAIQQFFDHDPRPGCRDYACGSLAYDGHSGTDIRVPDLPAMRRGVAVVAAAPGKVRNTRDGMRDIDVRDINAADLVGRDAGNAVVIVHGEGWESQYSHLRLGSVAVEPGDTVVAGQSLGLIGMSGAAAFPHLEFTVRHNGVAIDPFVGPGRHEGCGVGPGTLWSDSALAELKYVTSGILGAGFASAVPDWKRAREGSAFREKTLPTDAPVMTFWVSIYGARSGDRTALKLLAPDGTVVAQDVSLVERNKANWFVYVGRKYRAPGWLPGVYKGNFELIRDVDGEAQPVVKIVRELAVR